MKIEVGQFVRVKGYIGKICNINEFREPSMEIGIDIPQARDVVFRSREDITKASFNIIDLIEVGDYVNGEIVEDITREYLRINGQSHNKYYFSKQIKSILTKEQFEANSYKVGE